MDLKDHIIIAQSAGAHAATVIAAEIATGNGCFDTERFETVRNEIYQGVMAIVNIEETCRQQGAVAQVQTAFPGAVEVPMAQILQHPASAAPVAPAQALTAPPVPPAYPTAPALPPVPPMVGQPAITTCPHCNSPVYDNRADNNRKRQLGFKLGADFKCSGDGNACPGGKGSWGWAQFPADFSQHKNKPQEPR